jgi:hypothetical protein
MSMVANTVYRLKNAQKGYIIKYKYRGDSGNGLIILRL